MLVRPGSKSRDVLCPSTGWPPYTFGGTIVTREAIASPYTIIDYTFDHGECWTNRDPSTWLYDAGAAIADYAVGVRWKNYFPYLRGGGIHGSNTHGVVLVLSQAIFGCTRLYVPSTGGGVLLSSDYDPGAVIMPVGGAWNDMPAYSTNAGASANNAQGQRSGDGLYRVCRGFTPSFFFISLLNGPNGKIYSPFDPAITTAADYAAVFIDAAVTIKGTDPTPTVRGYQAVLDKDGVLQTRYTSSYNCVKKYEEYSYFYSATLEFWGCWQSLPRTALATDLAVVRYGAEVNAEFNGTPGTNTYPFAMVDAFRHANNGWGFNGTLAMPIINPPGLTEKIWPAIYRDVTP
jgi:hypothetical protein